MKRHTATDEPAALVSNYAYLWRSNPLWLANLNPASLTGEASRLAVVVDVKRRAARQMERQQRQHRTLETVNA
jgi:hypothetical protein